MRCTLPRRHIARLFVATAWLASAIPAPAAPADDLKALIADHWAWSLAESPELASQVGVHDRDADLDDASLAAAERRAAKAAALLERLDAIDATALSAPERTNRAILRHLLAEKVEANRFGQRMTLFTSYYSPHQGFADLARSLSLRRRLDYENWIARLGKFPAKSDQIIAVSAQAAREGYAQPCDALGGFEGTITGVITADPAQSRFYKPFLAAKPVDASDADWTALQARARSVIAGAVFPAYAKFADFYLKQYKPRCAVRPGVSAQPNGAAYYAFRVRVETTTELTPGQVHAIGLREVARIGAEIDALAHLSGYPDRAAMVRALRGDPRSFASSQDQLLAAAALQGKTIDGKLPGFFGRLPRLPYGIKPIPTETAGGTTTAYYEIGSIANGVAGMFNVNTSKLDQRPLWELPALTAHEAVPGHHLQLALQQELDLPEFRKHLAGFTAFEEGWALYSEHLGIELGLYDTPAKQLGRLSYEMWRACRLVVDTGIHAKGWSKPQAIAFIAEHTALSPANIEAEVNRYISWPGQALGYKIGELEIRRLRTKSEQALGSRFDLRAFHDAVIGQGAVPLDVLDARIDAWIGEMKAGS